MIYLFLGVSFVYLILFVLLLNGFIKSSNTSKLVYPNNKSVTIIVASRNEENNIQNCINSLINIDYPAHLLEIILVDDKSTDNTKSVMQKATGNSNKFIILDSRNDTTNNLIGKQNAIDTGVESSTGEIIFITDADCEVPVNWVQETIKYYDDDNVGMVCGFTNIKNNKLLFSELQSIDWIYLLAMASAGIGLNKTLSCIGNNITFRKNVYIEIGGYQNIDFSVTEDLALLKKISQHKENYVIKFPIDPECLVKTNPCRKISELYNQKKRWFNGGTELNLFRYLMGFELYVMNFILIFGLIFLPPFVYLSIISIKIISDLLITIPAYRKLKIRKLFIYYPFFQIYFALYGLLLPISFLFGNKINWKGRKF